MAGFRIGRGRDSRNPRQQQHPPPGPPPPGQYPAPGPGGGAPPGQGPTQDAGYRPPPGVQPTQPDGPHGWPVAGGGQGGGHARPGEPEYFGEPHPRPGGAPDPYANQAGHTQSFQMPDPYGPDQGGYGGQPAPPPGPRMHWKELLRGIVLQPGPTFWRMRDHPVWGPALLVTFLYGLLAVFGLDEAREDVLNSTLTTALQYVIGTGVAMTIMGVMLGAVTHTLARQLGGNGLWAPTIGLSMLIMAISDAPRLLFAMFLGGTASLVQILGWGTWLAAGALFTAMVSRSHDLPWPRALAASAIQLIAILMLMKLGTL